MTTARNRATGYLIVDMSTIRFQWNPEHTACAAMTARGEIVAVVDADDIELGTRGRDHVSDERLMAFRLLDAALDRGQILRPDPDDPERRIAYRVALYNPFSAEVSLAAVPRTVTVTDRKPIAVPADGLPAEGVAAGRSPHLNLPDGRALTARELTFAGMTRIQLAHQAA